MAYDSAERSTHAGQDIRLYAFSRGNRVWRYNNSDRNVTYGGLSYESLAISDDGVKQKIEVIADDFTLTVPSYVPIVVMFRGTPPSEPIGMEMRQMQFGDTEAPIMWRGYVSSVKYKDEVTSSVVCNTQTPSLSRKGLRLSYERGCPHALYDDDCGVNKADWAEPATITALSGNGFTFALASDLGRWAGRFSNGFVEWKPDPDYTERRSIQVHDGSNCIIMGITDGLVVGMSVVLYPGCQRNPTNCKLFNNISNYGGFAFMPGRSPFSGDPVF